jgi:hypothetical protein
MSYLHCPTCQCAYNLSSQASCPRCGARAGAPLDPTEDVIAAAEQLARAVGRATPVQLAQAQAELAMRDANRALPAPGALPSTAPSLLRAVRAALAPAPRTSNANPVVTGHAQQALLTTVVLALLTRIPRPRPVGVRAWATTHVLPRVNAARALLARN